MSTLGGGGSWEEFRQGYVLAFGDLGSFADYSLIQSLIFIGFNFFIPLTLMNMLIAIMSDTYGRVQGNAKSADARALAEMELEMEQLAGYFRPVESVYRYTIFTKPVTAEMEKEEEETEDPAKATIALFEEKLTKLQELIGQLEEKQMK